MVQYNIDLTGKTVLITGAAGFIGANLAKRLLQDYTDIQIIGVDCITDYYDVNLKYERLKELETFGKRFQFVKMNIADKVAIKNLFAEAHPHVVVNLAAQAGVRYSITNPDAYIESIGSLSTL